MKGSEVATKEEKKPSEQEKIEDMRRKRIGKILDDLTPDDYEPLVRPGPDAPDLHYIAELKRQGCASDLIVRILRP